MTGRLERMCRERNLRISGPRRIILDILDRSTDHPCAEEIYRQAAKIQSTINLATVYRTLNRLTAVGVVCRVELGDGKTHYEVARNGHHDHLIDVESGKIVEFRDADIEAQLRDAADRLGYRLLEYRLRIFATGKATAPDTTPGSRSGKKLSRYACQSAQWKPDAQSFSTTNGTAVVVRATEDETGK
jgi:Fur family ferric uptake transcriptional regulator